MPRKTRVLSKRKLSFNENASKSPSKRFESSQNDETTWESDLSDIVGKWWTIYNVSPLAKLNYGKLQMYGKKLREGLAAMYRNSDDTFRAVFTVREGLKLNEGDHNGLLLEVTNGTNKAIYRGFFVNWSGIQLSGHPDFVHLPILLVAANKQIVMKVHEILSKFFDCVICEVKLTMCDLLDQVCGLLYTYFTNYKVTNKLLSLHYNIPGSVSAKDTITLNLTVEDTVPVLKLLLELFQDDPSITEQELSGSFYERILRHVAITYRLNLTCAELTKVVLPVATITKEGRVKWMKEDMADTSLRFLQQQQDANIKNLETMLGVRSDLY